MAFTELTSLDADNTIAIGGFNKKLKKDNPTSVEGYFLGSRTVDSPKSKTGTAKIHYFQTSKGNVGVWGKTDMDRKIANVTPGTMTRVAFDRLRALPTGNDMYIYKVAVDKENTIEVSAPTESSFTSNSEEETESFESGLEETDVDSEEAPLDEAPVARPRAPTVAAKAPDAARQAKVAALLGRNKSA